MSGAPRRWGGGRLIVASHNAGKVREISELLARFDCQTVSAADLGLEAPEETETTFEGNATLKALYAAREGGAPALADDSGLEIDAIDGRPGVHTADWAETPEGRDFGLAMRRARDAIAATGAAEPWTARFVCCLCLAWPDGHTERFLGHVDGRAVWPPRGDQGHGYDPMFVRAGETETFGEMSFERKMAVNHRTIAFDQLVAACFANGADAADR